MSATVLAEGESEALANNDMCLEIEWELSQSDRCSGLILIILPPCGIVMGQRLYSRAVIWGKLSYMTTLGTDNTNERAEEKRYTL